MNTLPRVGFIGLGYMGHGMAANILKHGYRLAVMAHRKRAAVDDLVAQGAVEAATPAEVAAQSDIVILCVTGAVQVDEVVRGPVGLGASANAGLIVIDCTTSEPSTLLRLDRDFGPRGMIFVDAPLGRSPREAWKGALSTMVGCDATVLGKIHPVLSAFATTIQHVGGLGDGHRLKLVNNFISLGFAALYAEALVMARKAGFTVETFDQLVRSSRMHCAFYDTFIGWAMRGDADSHPFALDTALHTISDVVALQQVLAVESRLSSGIRELYQRAVDAGEGNAMLTELPRSVAMTNSVALEPVKGPKTV